MFIDSYFLISCTPENEHFDFSFSELFMPYIFLLLSEVALIFIYLFLQEYYIILGYSQSVLHCFFFFS